MQNFLLKMRETYGTYGYQWMTVSCRTFQDAKEVQAKIAFYSEYKLKPEEDPVRIG